MTWRMLIPRTKLERIQLQADTTKILALQRLNVAKNKLGSGAKTPEQLQSRLARYGSDSAIVKAAGKPKQATRDTYIRLARSLWHENRYRRPSFVWRLVEQCSGSKASWYARKAAVQFFLMEQMDALKRKIDRYHRWEKRRPAVFSSTKARSRLGGFCQELKALAIALESTPSGGGPQKFLGKKQKRSPNSKSQSIKRQPDDWREQVAARLSDNYKLLYLVQCVTGCRPAELAKARGIEFAWTSDGLLTVSTPGAKITDSAGQEQREMVFESLSGVARELVRHMGHLGLEENAVHRTAEFFPVGGDSDVEVKRVKNYCAVVARAGLGIPGGSSKSALTAYSARHQFMADLRTSGMSRDAIAMVMGHRTTRSAVYYGRGGRGSAGFVVPAVVQATHPVKSRMQPPGQRASATNKSIQQPVPVAKPKAAVQQSKSPEQQVNSPNTPKRRAPRP